MQVVILILYDQKRYLLLVVETLEITGPVNRNLVTRPLTIEGADVPPILCNTERLRAAG